MGNEGDVLWAFSTSGNSANIIEAVKMAKAKKMIVLGFTGNKEGQMNSYCDIVLQVPSSQTPRIQEAHITVGHIICELVENTLFGSPS